MAAASLVGLLTAWSALWGAWAEMARQQKEAVATIQNLGGQVMYDYQKVKGGKLNVYDPKALPSAPKKLREALGDDFFRVVVFVSFRGTPVIDDDLKQLKKLPNLENLDLAKTRITSAGLAHLRGLKNIHSLGLWNTRVGDKGVEHLKGMTNLWQLVLDGTDITDAGVAHLNGLTNLEEWLGLADTQVTDEGLKHLQGLTKLRSLNLRRTAVTAAGVGKLRLALPKTDISFGD